MSQQILICSRRKSKVPRESGLGRARDTRISCYLRFTLRNKTTQYSAASNKKIKVVHFIPTLSPLAGDKRGAPGFSAVQDKRLTQGNRLHPTERKAHGGIPADGCGTRLIELGFVLRNAR